MFSEEKASSRHVSVVGSFTTLIHTRARVFFHYTGKIFILLNLLKIHTSNGIVIRI